MSKNGTNWGGHGMSRPDGSYHFTLWRADPGGGRGERLSWDQGSPERNVHHTDQNSGQHSSDPKDWRRGHTGEEMLGGACALVLAIPVLLALAAVIVLAVVSL